MKKNNKFLKTILQYRQYFGWDNETLFSVKIKRK